MIMKHLKKIFVISALLLGLVISCDKDDYNPPYNDYSSFLWLTTNGFEETEYVSALNDYVGFRDVSKNTIEHSWSIPSGTKLLSNDFTENDSIYTEFVTGSGPLSTDENLVNVLFDEPGIKEIKLRNVFKDSVTESVQMNGNWIVDKTFTVTVFDDVKPAFQVLKGTDVVLSVSEADMPDEANSASWATVTIEAGEQLTYVDNTTVGEPDARTWTFNGGNMDTSGAASANVSYNGLGNFLAGSINSRRNSPDKPDGETSKLIPLKIEVIPSTQPFVLNGGMLENATEVISFNVTGEIATLTGEEGNFTVNVVNTAAGFNQNIPVQSAVINGSDATQIDLTLSAPIYNSDNITVEYSSGNIISIDSRTLESFSATNVTMHRNDNIIGDVYAGFESESTNWKKGLCNGFWVGNSNDINNDTNPPYYFSRVTSEKNSGSASMKFESLSGITNITLQGSNFTKGGQTPHGIPTLPAGSYEVSYFIYLDTGNTMLAFRTEVQGGLATVWDVSTLPRGEWVEISNTIVVPADVTNKKFDIKVLAADNGGVTGGQIMYFDDLSWRPIESR